MERTSYATLGRAEQHRYRRWLVCRARLESVVGRVSVPVLEGWLLTSASRTADQLGPGRLSARLRTGRGVGLQAQRLTPRNWTAGFGMAKVLRMSDHPLRATVEMKRRGLTPEQARARSMPPIRPSTPGYSRPTARRLAPNVWTGSS